jgi:hypothetical protein
MTKQKKAKKEKQETGPTIRRRSSRFSDGWLVSVAKTQTENTKAP